MMSDFHTQTKKVVENLCCMWLPGEGDLPATL